MKKEMGTLEAIRNSLTGGLAGIKVGAKAIGNYMATAEAVAEELEARTLESQLDAEIALANDDAGWTSLDGNINSVNLNRQSIRRAANLSRVMYLLNPLIKRAVTVQELYVWGSGCEIKAEDDVVKEVLHDFFSDPKNQSVIGEAWPEREREQRIDGNTFFIFYLNRRNGSARVRLIPFDEVSDIICNPEDLKEPWLYKRTLPEGSEYRYYPDINYNPKRKPTSHKDADGEGSIDWDTRVLHVKTGGLSTMKFGMPEMFSVLGWARAYKKILENFATVIQAYARIAMKISGLANARKTAAAKNKLNTSITSGSTLENNPATNTASWAALSGNADITPIKTAGSTTGPDEARALRSMVAAGTDTPEHFFGDSDIGNFATSSTLDRPTELKMVARQNMWKYVILTMCRFLIQWSAVAPVGKLRLADFKAEKSRDYFDGTETVTVTHSAKKNLHVAVIFPTILERDVVDRVRAVVQAATLGGSPAEGIIPDRGYLFKMLMIALGEKDAEHLMNKYYPTPVTQGFINPADKAENERLAADGKKKLGDAAIIAANAQKKKADAPPPKATTVAAN